MKKMKTNKCILLKYIIIFQKKKQTNKQNVSMWKFCLQKCSCLTFVQRRFVTMNRKPSIIDNVMNSLLINYQKEYDQLQTIVSDESIERKRHLKAILHIMNKREGIIRDMNETRKLLQGNNKNKNTTTIDLKINFRLRRQLFMRTN